MNGEREVMHDAMCNDPRGREFMGKTSIIAVKGWRVDMKRGVTMSKSTSPVCEGNGSEVTEEGKVMIKVTNKANNSSRVIEAGDGWKVKAMKVKRSKELGVEGKGKIEVAMNLVCNSLVEGCSIWAKQGLKG